MFFPLSQTLSLTLSPPTELLSACHELHCRYGCIMTRNGTFCFCADGFEVGEDGRSCRGRRSQGHTRHLRRMIGFGGEGWLSVPRVSFHTSVLLALFDTWHWLQRGRIDFSAWFGLNETLWVWYRGWLLYMMMKYSWSIAMLWLIVSGSNRKLLNLFQSGNTVHNEVSCIFKH